MSVISGKKLTIEMQRLKETGKIDGLIGADNVGRLLDHWNQGVEKRHEKSFNKDVTDRNQYYWKLWKRAIGDVASGRRKPAPLNIKKTFT